MPSTSDKQRRAMHAAAAGNSTIGIPQSVGKEYTHADGLRKGNSTYNGIHTTHWKPSKSKKNASGGKSGGAAIGGAA